MMLGLLRQRYFAPPFSGRGLAGALGERRP